MKERPILFSASMVRALLSGSKTQTRRAFKMPSGHHWDELQGGQASGSIESDKWPGTWHVSEFSCPYGQPGDRLWVREAWRIGAWNENTGAIAIDYMADAAPVKSDWITVPEAADDYHGGSVFERYWQQSTDDCIKAGIKPNVEDKYNWQPGQSPCRKRPSIHMPRWASRITLEIVSVRVERLQDISEADALAEGVTADCPVGNIKAHQAAPISYCYAQLWESINGPGSWDANPWVWRVEFKVVKP